MSPSPNQIEQLKKELASGQVVVVVGSGGLGGGLRPAAGGGAQGGDLEGAAGAWG